ncbi:ATP-binding protein, partial [Neobacillus vireti]|uniref:sensor histidine kinase n=1 Tax=Neobacillus vireti TaxID=220686 RepID=UPI002FFF8F53
LVDHNPYVTKDILRELRSTIRQTVSEIRGLVYDLRPPTLDEMGLIGAIHERIKDLAAPSSTQRGIVMRDRPTFILNAHEQLPELPAAVEVAAYRITTEAIVNVLRHAKAKTCNITLAYKNQQERGLIITIEDDGIGVSPIRKNKKNSGIGIGSMKERAAELGGRFCLEPNVQGGTVITVFLPVNTE